MPSEKLMAILRAKSPFSSDEIAAMSEADGWRWVYQNKPAYKDRCHEICFTGFATSDCAELATLAGHAGVTVKESVTTTLAYLCVGDTPGPSKIEKAKRQGVTFLNRAVFGIAL
jgi:NAD-dependent DNA ligase